MHQTSPPAIPRHPIPFRRFLRAFCSAMALALASGSSRAAAVDSRVEIKIPGTLVDLFSFDLDGDGAQELIVTTKGSARNKSAGRGIHAYALAPGPKLESRFKLDVPADAVAFGLADFLGTGRAQVIYLTARSVVVWEPETSSPTRVIADHDALLSLPDPDRLPFWDLTNDLNADGRDDLILADPSGYGIWLQQADHSFALSGTIEAEADFRTIGLDDARRVSTEGSPAKSRDSLSFGGGGSGAREESGSEAFARYFAIGVGRGLGRIVAANANADDRTDLLLLRRRHVGVYVQDDFGGFGSSPAQVVAFGPNGDGGSWDESGLPITHGDIDGDGRVDFVTTEIEAGDLASRLRLYKWGADGPAATPDQIIKLSGLGEAPHLIDVNGDGSLDLVYLAIRAIEMLQLRKPKIESIGATCFVYLFDSEKGLFSRRPQIKRDFEIAITGEMDEEQARDLFNFAGDFDGDGFNDFLSYDNQGTLSIHAIKASRAKPMKVKLNSKPLATYEIKTPDALALGDFDGDGRADIALRQESSILVLMSQ